MSGEGSPLSEDESGESLDESIPWPQLNYGTAEEWDSFLLEFEQCLLYNAVPEGQKMNFLWELLRESPSQKALHALKAAQWNVEITNVTEALSAITKFYARESYLKRRKASVEEKLKAVKYGWFEQNGFFLNGIAFPIILELSAGYLPVFLTCAHCARKKGEEYYKPKILLTPSDSLDPDDSFPFELESDMMVFGCDPEGDPLEYFDCSQNKNEATLDFLALFVKNKKNRKDEFIKQFWTARREVNEGDKVYIAATHENCEETDIPYTDDATVVNPDTNLFDESVKDAEHVMLHGVVGIQGLSGECMYAPDKMNRNKLECLLMFKGKLNEPQPSKPLYVGIPIPAIQKYLEQFGEELNPYCFEKIPEDFVTDGFVKSYLLLLSDDVPSSPERETSSEGSPVAIQEFEEKDRETVEDNGEAAASFEEDPSMEVAVEVEPDLPIAKEN